MITTAIIKYIIHNKKLYNVKQIEYRALNHIYLFILTNNDNSREQILSIDRSIINDVCVDLEKNNTATVNNNLVLAKYLSKEDKVLLAL